MTTATTLPAIIQGGMGVAVSDWRLAECCKLLLQNRLRHS